MKTLFTIICLLFILTGCENSKIENKKTIVVDNQTYILVRPAYINDNGINDAELWEKVGVTNRYYTPSLDGKMMLPLMR